MPADPALSDALLMIPPPGRGCKAVQHVPRVRSADTARKTATRSEVSFPGRRRICVRRQTTVPMRNPSLVTPDYVLRVPSAGSSDTSSALSMKLPAQHPVGCSPRIDRVKDSSPVTISEFMPHVFSPVLLTHALSRVRMKLSTVARSALVKIMSTPPWTSTLSTWTSSGITRSACFMEPQADAQAEAGVMTGEPHPLDAVFTAPQAAAAVFTAPPPQEPAWAVLTSSLLPHAPGDFESVAPVIVAAIDIATATASIATTANPNAFLWP